MINIPAAISGAGTNGGAEVGAVAALADNGIQITRPVGTSAGSITAALIALGRTPAQCKQIVLDADYAELIDYSYLTVPGRWTAASNKNVIAWLREITEDQAMEDCAIPLVTVSGNLVTQTPMYWRSWEVPKMPVWKAVYSSMAIPFIFPPYLGEYVDGGTMDNLPVNQLPTMRKRLALAVTSFTSGEPVSGPVDQALRLLSMMLEANVMQSEAYAKSLGIPVIKLDVGRRGFLVRDMTRSDKETLYQIGYSAVTEWLGSAEGKAWRASDEN